MLKGRIPLNKEKTPNTITTSWNKAAIALNEYCHLPKRNKMYAKIITNDNPIASEDDVINSPETVDETLLFSTIL